MKVTRHHFRFAPPEDTFLEDFVLKETHCFLCGSRLTVPMVFWNGATKNIGLHPECAQIVGSQILLDACFEPENAS